MKIILSGYGAMNKRVAKLAEEDGHTIAGVLSNTVQDDYPKLDDIKQVDADVIIDFSHPEHILPLLEQKIDLPIVVATTGNKEQINGLLEKHSKNIPVFFSANMSYGVHALTKILQAALPLLQEYDIELIEAHHNQKVDAPSGTLIKLLECIEEQKDNSERVFNREQLNRKRSRDEIGIHTIRGGSIVGDHEVLFAGEDETIQLTHKAGSKDIFARGAIKAAQKLITKPNGFYNFDNL